MEVFLSNIDILSDVSITFLEKYLEWLEEKAFMKDEDGTFYWTDKAFAEEHAKVKKYLDKKRNIEEGLELRRKFAKEFNKYKEWREKQ